MKILTPKADIIFECRDARNDPSDDHDLDYKVVKETWVENVYQIKEEDFWDTGVFIDIGANIGAVSIFVALMNKNRDKTKKPIKVFSYEPEPHNLEFFRTNIKNNNIGDIKVIPKAVFKERGTISISDRGGNSSIFTRENTSTVEVPVVTLEDVFILNKLTECDVMKIDIEGAEYDLIINTPDEILKKIKYLTLEFDGGHEEKFGVMVTKIARLFNTHILGSPERGGYIYARRY